MIRVAAEQFAADSVTYLERVERGEEVWIERDGQVVARLVAVAPGKSGEAASETALSHADDDPAESELARRFRELRKGNRLDGLSLKELIEEGRT